MVIEFSLQIRFDIHIGIASLTDQGYIFQRVSLEKILYWAQLVFDDCSFNSHGQVLKSILFNDLTR